MVVATTGFFDGLHKGHQKVLDCLCSTARKNGQKSAVVTFWPHPRAVLQKNAESFRLLTSLEEKQDLIRAFGVDDLYVVSFTKEFSKLSAREFIKEYLIDKYNVDTLIVGYDHRLGNENTSEDITLPEIAQELGIKCVRVDEFDREGVVVSSTKIRHKIIEGDVESASDMLGYNYMLKGVVVMGRRIGRSLGFPTANMQLYEPLKVVPKNGVYAVKVTVDGKFYIGMCNIGVRPTFGLSTERTIETHILNFNEDIYGLDIKIEFLERVRDEISFNSKEELVSQLKSDLQIISKHLCIL